MYKNDKKENQFYILYFSSLISHSFVFFFSFCLNYSHSAGSSSNVSSSNGNNSDHGFNSLEDSIENDIQQQSNRHIVDRHKNRMPTLITSSDSMSYLGPFNFRQLLRPVHERNNARNIAVPIQRKRTQPAAAVAVTTAKA